MLDPLRDFPLVRDGYRKGRAEGKAEGKAESVLTVLKARGIRVSTAVREKVLSCADPVLLERWLISAASAKNADDVLGTS